MPEKKPPSRAGINGNNELALVQQLHGYRRALKVKEVADLLHCSDQTVYRMMHEEWMPYFTVREGYRIDPNALAEWLKRRHMDVA